MKFLTDETIASATMKIYEGWFSISNSLTIIDLVILNRMTHYHDMKLNCGLKELAADLNISKSCISKAILRWANGGFITKTSSNNDGRRHFFIPTPMLLEKRAKAFENLRQALTT